MKPTHLITIAFSLMANIIGAHAQRVVSDTLDFDRAIASSPAGMLQGRLSGVLISQYSGNPNGALNTSVRGTNSLRPDNQPLWIIDGAILGESDNQNLVPFWQYAGKVTLEVTGATAGTPYYLCCPIFSSVKSITVTYVHL